MSDLLFHWQKDNYQNDRRDGFDYHLNQSSSSMKAVNIGESVWAFTRRNDGIYVLAAHLVVVKKSINPPGFRYGDFRVTGDRDSTIYFDLDGQGDVSPLIRSIVQAKAPILGRSFQGHSGVREISSGHHTRLSSYASDLRSI